jgi:3-methyladenine DNA glycosylase/8-oxoguanine DNA glycosylase
LVDNTDMEHAREVFHKNARKIVTQAISYARIAASNQYLKKFVGQELRAFRDGSDTYLTEEQYAMVKHFGFHFFSYFALLILF